MTRSLFADKTQLDSAFASLRGDLMNDDGPRISTMRNYRFAIVCYHPQREFELRAHTQRLVSDLEAHGWVVTSISLQRLMLDRLRALGDETLSALIENEKRLAAVAPSRSLTYLGDQIARLIEGPEGIAADCARLIAAQAEAHPHKAERMLAIIGRAGALYPFFRSSALLHHLDGKTKHVPVVLLYPGTKKTKSGLSFMDRLKPDRDYRPRIYS